MNYEKDEKGKYFTNVIKKEPTQARIQTLTHLVDGEVHIRRECRLKDELDLPEPFLAVTNATLYTPDGQVFLRTNFLAIKRDQIIWVTIAQDILKDKSI